MTQPSPPQPLPDTLWGDRWQFVGLAAGELETILGTRPMPIRSMPMVARPSHCGLAATTLIPGLVIEAGRRSLRLARWLEEEDPTMLLVRAGQPGGVVLQTQAQRRWVLVTYEDAEVARAAELFEDRLRQAEGLHFLLIQPDDSGVTHTGLWVLRATASVDL